MDVRSWIEGWPVYRQCSAPASPRAEHSQSRSEMGRVTVRRPVLTLSAQGERGRVDALAGEEPLELRVGGRPLAVTMRTPATTSS